MKLLERRTVIDKNTLPLAVLRNSLIIILLNGTLLCSFLFFVKLNNSISVPAEIRSTQDPLPIFSKKTGVFIFTAKDGDKVTKGQTIGYHEQNGDLALITTTNTYINQLTIDDLTNKPFEVYNEINVGGLGAQNLESSFEKLKENLIDYLSLITIEKGFLDKKINLLSKKERLENDKIAVFDVQDSLSNVQKELLHQQNVRDSLLFVAQILSPDEAEVNQLELINERKNAIRNYINRFSSFEAIKSIELEELATKTSYFAALYKQKSKLKNTLNKVKNSILAWENENLAKAVSEGTVLAKNTENRIPINANEVLAFISPPPVETPEYVIYLDIPTKHINYVKKEQNVRIKVNEYPFLEYGVIEGEIINIPDETANDYYRCEARLLQGINTNYGRKLSPKNRYNGVAQVSLKRENLLRKVKNILTWQYSSYRR